MSEDKPPAGDNELDRYDYLVSGMAGLLAGMADVAFVGLPRNPLTRFGAAGGLLSNAVRATFGRALPAGRIASLEAGFPVPFDAATNHGLLQMVPGLYPLSHRFHSLGHDPLLGWLFGVRDIMNGAFTALGRDGVAVVQASGGQTAFIGILEAFRRVGGHMLSDVATPMGLPAPLMPLSQFVQFGTIGPEGLSIAETARRMYLAGYDFRHFVAGGLTTAIVEAIVRVFWMLRRLDEGVPFHEAIPCAAGPRLRRQLLLGHAVATALNAGKLAALHNPLALNWAQWLITARYLAPEGAGLKAPVAEGARFAAKQVGYVKALVGQALWRDQSA